MVDYDIVQVTNKDEPAVASAASAAVVGASFVASAASAAIADADADDAYAHNDERCVNFVYWCMLNHV